MRFPRWLCALESWHERKQLFTYRFKSSPCQGRLKAPVATEAADGLSLFPVGRANVTNPPPQVGLAGTLGVWEVHDQRGVRDEMFPCLQKEAFHVCLELIGKTARRLRWALLSVADGQKSSLPGLLNQQLYWAPTSPWNNECVSCGCCLAVVVQCQELRRSNGAWGRDWRSNSGCVGLLEGSIPQGGCSGTFENWTSETKHWTLDVSQTSISFSMFSELEPLILGQR